MFKHGHLVIPTIFLASYAGIFFFIDGMLPEPEALIEQLSTVYGRFGYEIVFISAILEATILINLFVPGVLAITFGAVFAKTGQIDLTMTIILATMGAMVGFLIDYSLGYFGFGKLVDKLGERRLFNKIKKHLHYSYFKTFGLGYFHPNVGAVVSLAAGALRIGILKFLVLSTFSTLGWLSVWGILAFILGDLFLKVIIEYFYVLVLLIMSIWVLILFYEYEKK